jgi:hypothetical protein
MLFERILVLVLFTISFFLIVIPSIKLIKQLFSLMNFKIPIKMDPVKEAKKRLKDMEQEVEAAKLNKKTDQLIDELYNDSYIENKYLNIRK